jgi:hypothetical protein
VYLDEPLLRPLASPLPRSLPSLVFLSAKLAVAYFAFQLTLRALAKGQAMLLEPSGGDGGDER